MRRVAALAAVLLVALAASWLRRHKSMPVSPQPDLVTHADTVPSASYRQRRTAPTGGSAGPRGRVIRFPRSSGHRLRTTGVQRPPAATRDHEARVLSPTPWRTRLMSGDRPEGGRAAATAVSGHEIGIRRTAAAATAAPSRRPTIVGHPAAVGGVRYAAVHGCRCCS